MTPTRLIWIFLLDAFYNGYELIKINFIWVLLTLPVITAPAATGGLYYATNQLAHQNVASWNIFFEGFRKYWWMSWRWLLANVVVLIILGGGYLFYGQIQTSLGTLLQGFLMVLIAVWLLLQVYTYPLLLEQEERSFIIALRNSLVFFLRAPGYSLSLAVVVLGLAVLSTYLRVPWFLFTAGLIAYLANRGMLHLLNTLTGEPSSR